MAFVDYVVMLCLSIVLIIGGYQIYFLPQKTPLRAPYTFSTKFDELIPFYPSWVWVYSGLYYPMILVLCIISESFREFCYMAISFVSLLMLHLIFFYFFPIKTPSSWRDFNRYESRSTRLLALIHKYDSPVNCFPSTHVSVATLTALYMQSYLDANQYWGSGAIFAFPILISLSAVFTKQHYLVDLPAGVVLGAFQFKVVSLI